MRWTSLRKRTRTYLGSQGDGDLEELVNALPNEHVIPLGRLPFEEIHHAFGKRYFLPAVILRGLFHFHFGSDRMPLLCGDDKTRRCKRDVSRRMTMEW